VQWLLLGLLAIMWAAFLVPAGRRRSDARSVEDFERRMELLAQAEVHGTSGRWIVTPRKGVRFLGPRERQQARARARRRRIFVFLLEAIGLSLLIGIVPPLRVAWLVSAAFGGLLAAGDQGPCRRRAGPCGLIAATGRQTHRVPGSRAGTTRHRARRRRGRGRLIARWTSTV
jgi:hypothetical protein